MLNFHLSLKTLVPKWTSLPCQISLMKILRIFNVIKGVARKWALLCITGGSAVFFKSNLAASIKILNIYILESSNLF